MKMESGKRITSENLEYLLPWLEAQNFHALRVKPLKPRHFGQAIERFDRKTIEAEIEREIPPGEFHNDGFRMLAWAEIDGEAREIAEVEEEKYREKQEVLRALLDYGETRGEIIATIREQVRGSPQLKTTYERFLGSFKRDSDYLGLGV
jgi:hypothetical protein